MGRGWGDTYKREGKYLQNNRKADGKLNTYKNGKRRMENTYRIGKRRRGREQSKEEEVQKGDDRGQGAK